jgi:hypothetical protein
MQVVYCNTGLIGCKPTEEGKTQTQVGGGKKYHSLGIILGILHDLKNVVSHSSRQLYPEKG